MELKALIIFVAVVCSGLQSSSAENEITCGQVIENVDKEGKLKAQLCHLTELADVLNGMSSTLHEALVALLNEQGVSVENMYDLEKRGNEYLRFGKRKHEYLRFGKRKNEYLRFGK